MSLGHTQVSLCASKSLRDVQGRLFLVVMVAAWTYGLDGWINRAHISKESTPRLYKSSAETLWNPFACERETRILVHRRLSSMQNPVFFRGQVVFTSQWLDKINHESRSYGKTQRRAACMQPCNSSWWRRLCNLSRSFITHHKAAPTACNKHRVCNKKQKTMTWMLWKCVDQIGWCSPAMADIFYLHPGKNNRVLRLLEFNIERGISIQNPTKFLTVRNSLSPLKGV